MSFMTFGTAGITRVGTVIYPADHTSVHYVCVAQDSVFTVSVRWAHSLQQVNEGLLISTVLSRCLSGYPRWRR